jgi:hypothetical protein
MNKENISAKFEHLYKVISSQDFLNKKALGGEIPFFISAYNPLQHNEVDKAVKGLIKKLQAEGVDVLEINLYGLSMELLDRELGEGEIFRLEKEMDKYEFKNALQSVLNISEVLMPAIRQKVIASEAKVYFLTGVGLVYPFLRSHNVLNNLQSIATEAPTVMFFPGEYSGQSLELFGLLKDDNYYRAFDLDKNKTV